MLPALDTGTLFLFAAGALILVIAPDAVHYINSFLLFMIAIRKGG